MRRVLAVLFAVAILAPAGGCGDSGTVDVDDAALMLDFTPNAVHAGIYTAVARDFDGAEGVQLRVRQPSESTDSVRLLDTGRVELAVLDISDLALARERGSDVVGVMALVQRPLAAVLARPGVRRPRDLEGRRAGVSGLPSDVAVLNSVVRGDGGDPRRVRRTTIGFTAVPALVGGRVAGATAFWNVEGLALRDRLKGAREFRVDEFGAPAYPELVLCATRRTLDESPELVAGTVAALRRGYEEVLKDPESAVETMLRRVDGLEREPLLDGLRAVQPAFTAGVPRYGMLDPARLEAWSRWAQRFGIVEERPDIGRAFAPAVANR
jgi:ABC-type nitrate/sulfonate/bicarbonate transport system substrate-binding protein